MSSKFLFTLGQRLVSNVGSYRITNQVSEFVYFAVNQNEQPVVIKSVEGHWRLQNERDILNRFQGRTPTLRPLLDEIKNPVEPPAIVLEHLDDDLTRASRKRRLTRLEIKYVARHVLQALEVLHDDGYIHTDVKPSNILVNYGSGENRFAEVKLADCGGTVSMSSEFAKDAVITGTNLFRAPEIFLEIPWGPSADIWSFGVTLINLIWALNFHIFEPEVSESDEQYELRIVARQHQFFGPFPFSYKEITDEDRRHAISGIMSLVPPEKMKPFHYLNEREISDADKAFLLKIMKLDPRDRPTAKLLLQDEWFTETSERTIGWYSKEDWEKLQQQSK